MRDEWQLITSYGEHHRRLLGRLGLVLVLTAVIDVVGAVAMFMLERHSAGSQIHTIGQAFFFSSVQLLTVSSQMPNPVTPARPCGRRAARGVGRDRGGRLGRRDRQLLPEQRPLTRRDSC